MASCASFLDAVEEVSGRAGMTTPVYRTGSSITAAIWPLWRSSARSIDVNLAEFGQQRGPGISP